MCVLVLALLFFFYSPEDKKKTEKVIERKPNDWYRKTEHKSLDPYGSFIFYQLLRQQNKNIRLLKKNSQYKDLDTIKTKPRLYVFIGDELATHFKRMEKIMDFVSRGNHAFIATNKFPERILEVFSNDYKTSRSYYKNVELNFTDSLLAAPKNYNFKFYFKRKNIFRYWTDFQRISYEYESYGAQEADITVLEKNMVTYNPVFLKIRYGKGYFYLHSVPYTTTNLVMKHEIGLKHAERMISCLPEEPVIFDTYINSVNGNDSSAGSPKKRSSPLQFILENRSLRWAYYLLLGGFILYLVFKGKRMQKIVPPKEKFDNTSLDFADTMSKLYLQYGQHKYIVFQQEKNLVNYIRSRYYIHAQKVDEDYINRVATKSGISQEKITWIFDRFNRVKKSNYATSNDVVEIYAEIEYFYKNCK